MHVTAMADHTTHPCTDGDLLHIYYPSEPITHIFIRILIIKMHFNICIFFKFNILYMCIGSKAPVTFLCTYPL
jgi:hypothetical protein